RPILKEAAKFYNLEFNDLKNYSFDSLIKGHPKQFKIQPTMLDYRGHFILTRKPLFKASKASQNFVKGSVAYAGKTTGKAKIVKVVADLNKVKIGDILVTQMTFPSFIMAMQRAKAFVTDEGGLTCHAAIVA